MKTQKGRTTIGRTRSLNRALKLLRRSSRAVEQAKFAVQRSESSVLSLCRAVRADELSFATAAEPKLNNPPRDEVAPKVIVKIALMAKKLKASQTKIIQLLSGDESLNLESDLKILEDDRKRLSGAYTIISQSFGGTYVGLVDAKNATTVAKAIKLVHEKSNLKP